jgi:hypothetical protein
MSMAVAKEQPEPGWISTQNQHIQIPVPVEVLEHSAQVATDIDSAQICFMVPAHQIVEKDLCGLAFAQDDQVSIPVSVQISSEDHDAGAPRAGYSCRDGDVRESAVTVVVPQLVAGGTRIAHENVQVTVMIRIQEKRRTTAGRLAANACLAGDIDKGAVAFATEKTIAPSADHEKVNVFIVVEVTQRTSQNTFDLFQTGASRGIRKSTVGLAQQQDEPPRSVSALRSQNHIRQPIVVEISDRSPAKQKWV